MIELSFYVKNIWKKRERERERDKRRIEYRESSLKKLNSPFSKPKKLEMNSQMAAG